MKTQMKNLALVLLLSISTIACSDQSGLSSSPTAGVVPEASAAALPSSTPAESRPSTTVESGAFKAVLLNKADFISTDATKKNVKLDEFLTNEDIFGTTFKVTHFTVVDMDSDEKPEVVLELTPSPSEHPEFYEVLHYMEGKVYGYIQVYRGLMALKTDGTFGFSGGVSHFGYGKLKFEPSASVMETVAEYMADEHAAVFTIGNKSVSEEAFRSFSIEQDGKKDAAWHAFSEENLNAMFASPEASFLSPFGERGRHRGTLLDTSLYEGYYRYIKSVIGVVRLL